MNNQENIGQSGDDPGSDDGQGAAHGQQIAGSGPAVRASRFKADPGFRRNMLLLGGAVAVALVATAAVTLKTQSAFSNAAEKNIPATTVSVGGGASPLKGDATELSPLEIERLKRVGQAQSQEASGAGKTFIPTDLPLSSVPTPPDAMQPQSGPGVNYSHQVGTNRTGAQNAQDARREQMISQGLDRQLQHMLGTLEPPATSQAGPYTVKNNKNDANSGSELRTSSSATSGSTGAPAAAGREPDLVPGLSIFGAQLTSPLDTAKTDYISARVTTGPVKGALLFGSGVVVGEEGVRVTFTQMAFEGKAYPIKAVALDTQSSSNAMQADIDRRIFSRYVIPIFGVMGQAYMDAIARPNQQVVVSDGATNIVTPGASARQAAAAGLGAGLGKAAEAATYSGPNTAYIPEGSAVGVLFNDPVKKGAAK